MKRLLQALTLLLVLLGLTVLVPALPQTAEAQPPTVNVIHKGRVITIPLMALPWHLAHGDSLEICPDGSLPPCAE